MHILVLARSDPNGFFIHTFFCFFFNDSGPATSSRAEKPDSSRSNPPISARSNIDTSRTSMSTARVHTALAALSAEKQNLLAKLAMIDSALETGEKKRVSVPRVPTHK